MIYVLLFLYLNNYNDMSIAYVYNYLITVRLQNAEGVPPENSQRHSLEQEITLALILKSHSKSAAKIIKKLDRRFPHGAGRLDSNWLEDEASAQLGVLIMNAHVSNIARTCYFELRRLAYIRRFLTSTATATLVSAFVLSKN